MTRTALPRLHEQVFDSIAYLSPVTGLTGHQLTRVIYGPWWTEDERDRVQRALGDLVQMGLLKVSGVTYSLTRKED